MHAPQRRRFQPLPGTQPPLRGLFVDRWGTLLEMPEREPCARFEDARFVPGAIDALFRAGHAGWRTYLIGNEDAVARGRLADATWEAFERALLAHLAGRGVLVARSYACLDHPQGKGAHRRPSVFRLPDTGLLYHAAQVDGVMLSQSWVVGDGSLEAAAASRVGCHTAGVRTGHALRDGAFQIEPELWADDLAGVVRELLACEAYARP
jgi:histidinol phosphatase-like enzyme